MLLPVRTLALCLILSLAPIVAQAQPRDTLRVEAVLREALDANPQIQIARNQVAIAANDRSIGNAGFLPTLTGRAGVSQTQSNSNQGFLDGSTQDVDGAVSTRQNATGELRWTLFDGLGRFAAYDRLGAELQAQRASTREEVEIALADVLDTYYDAARQQRQRAVLQTGVELSRERLRIAQTRRDLGAASDLEVRQARVDLNADSAALLRQESALTRTKAQLNRLLGGTRATTRYAVAGAIPVDTTLGLPALRATAAARSPAQQRAERAVRAAQAEEREARATVFPSLDATLSYGYSDLDAESGFLRSSTATDLSYGLSLTWDVFDGLDRQRRRQNAQVRTQNARLRLQDVSAQLDANLTSAFADYRNRLALVALERENLQAAIANVELALERFRLGTISSVELREVQEQRIQAEGRLLDARFEAKRAETELLRLSGQLLERAQR